MSRKTNRCQFHDRPVPFLSPVRGLVAAAGGVSAALRVVFIIGPCPGPCCRGHVVG
jgi:hypothetical protein